MTLTANGQAEVTRGDGSTLLIGPGTDYRLEKADFMAAPDDLNSDQPLQGGGEQPGLDVDGGRSMKLLVSLANWNAADSASWSTCVTDREALEAAWQKGTDEATLAWREGEVDRLRFGRCRGVDAQNLQLWYKTLLCEFRATDPRSYSIDEDDWVIDDLQAVVNSGPMRTMAWRFELAGPCTGGQLTCEITPGVPNVLQLPDVLTGHTLVVDARRGEVRDVTNATDAWVAVTGQVLDGSGRIGRLLSLLPGSSFMQFTSDTGSTTGTAYVRSCYP